MNEHLQAIATLFSLVNPFVCAMMFSGIVRGQSRSSAARSATSAVAIVGSVLLIAALLGSPTLKVFGISLDAFSVAGGGVLVFIGFSMLRGSSSPSTPEVLQQDSSSARLAPLILFAASPGTITGIITIAAAHRHLHSFPVTAIVAIVVVLAFTWALLLLASRRESASAAPGLTHEMVSRYMGLIIIAMGLQFALTGYRAFMAA